MGAVLDKPVVKKEVYSFTGKGVRGCTVSMQGWRVSMEDFFVAEPSISCARNVGLYGIFDGHGSFETSKYCKDHLLEEIIYEFEKHQTIEEMDPEMFKPILESLFISFDRQIHDKDLPRSGSTAVTTLLTPTDYIVANLGDSRCVLCRNGEAVPLSFDHKPILERERKRIEAAGLHVQNSRIEGDLAVSRSFGDFAYKANLSRVPEEQAVSCKPDVRFLHRHEADEYLVLACDGIWDVFPNPRSFIPEFTRFLKSYPTVEEAVAAFLDHCLELGSKDNMTMMVLLFEKAPIPDEEPTTKGKD